MDARHTLFYDGECGLCDRSVQLVLAHDRADRFRFAPLQSEYARRVLAEHGVVLAPGEALETVYVLTADGRLLDRSDAVLFVLSQLHHGGPLRALGAALPRSLRELGYRVIARNRLRWFGHADACRIPSPAERRKFIVDS